MTERKSLLEHALDVCLYAPVGLAISVTEELPQLIDKGRSRVNSQLTMAKMVGSFAVAQGQREAERVVRQATGRVSEGGAFGAPPGAPSEDMGAPREAPGDLGTASWATSASEAGPNAGDGAVVATPAVDTQSPPVTHDRPESAETPFSTPPSASPGADAERQHRPAADASGLAIPGYDALSASQVVQRLAGLSSEELEAVRTYEAATRGRRTILNRIAQLQGPGRS